MSFFIQVLMLFLLVSCKTTQQDRRQTKLGISVSEVSENGYQYNNLTIVGNNENGFLLQICKAGEEPCSSDLVTENTYALKGLKPGDYTVEVLSCSQLDESGKCSQWIGKTSFTQNPYQDRSAELYLTNERELDTNRKFVASALYAMLLEHKTNLDLCVTQQGLKQKDLEGSFHGRYLAILEMLLGNNPADVINSLSSIYKNESDPDLVANLRQFFGSGLELAGFEYTAKQNVRVTFVKFAAPPPPELQIFEPGTRDFNKKGILDYFTAGEASGHAAVKIERFNPETGNFDLYRYVSWPLSDSLLEDFYGAERGGLTYEKFRYFETELPPLTDDDLSRFEAWYRKEYADIPIETKVDQLVASRKKLKSGIGTKMGWKEAESISRLNSREFEKLVRKAVERRLDAETSKKTRQGADEKWFEKWEPYKLWATGKETQSLTEVQGDFQKYLDVEVRSAQQLKPLSQEEEMTLLGKMAKQKNKMRMALLLPENVEMDKFVNYKKPWYIANPEDILKRYYKFDPTGDEAWKKFVSEHKTQLVELSESIKSEKLVILKRSYGADIGSWTWDNFKTAFWTDPFESYHEALFETYTRGPKGGRGYGKEYKKLGNNCSCAAGRSLDVLYGREGYFSRHGTLPVTTPGSVESRAQKFVQEYKVAEARRAAGPRQEGGLTKAVVGLSAVAAISVVSIMVTGEVAEGVLHLSGGESLQDCFQEEQERFHEISELPFERMQGFYFQQRMLQFLLNQAP